MEPNRKSYLVEAFKASWERNPVEVIAAGAFTLGALAKLIDALSAARGRRAYAKQVNYRVRRGK